MVTSVGWKFIKALGYILNKKIFSLKLIQAITTFLGYFITFFHIDVVFPPKKRIKPIQAITAYTECWKIFSSSSGEVHIK